VFGCVALERWSKYTTTGAWEVLGREGVKMPPKLDYVIHGWILSFVQEIASKWII
jgi:hypothetical protein